MDIRKNIILSVFMLVSAFSYAENKLERLTLQQALQTGLANYETIKSKNYLAESAKENITNSKTALLPDLKFSAQQVYGTANSLIGPQYGFGEGMTSTGMPQESQNRDAAFGALYLLNFNCNIFSFGQISNNINLAKSEYKLRQSELNQEIFNYQIKVAGAYFNLLAVQQVVEVQKKNVERAEILLKTVSALTGSGLKPAVELSMSEAELAKARISLLRAKDKEKELSSNLNVLIGTDNSTFYLDNKFTVEIPDNSQIFENSQDVHPSLLQKQNLIDLSIRKTKVSNTEGLPKVNIIGSLAGRGSGFGYNYMSDNNAISQNYHDGIKISRSNYLVGIGINWNFTSFIRNRSKVASQRSVTKAIEMEKQLLNNELNSLSMYADEKITLTENQHTESLKQLEAAIESYNQYLTMYKSGLADISDVAGAMYALASAESEEKVISINIWQSYLLKIAGNGDVESFLSLINK